MVYQCDVCGYKHQGKLPDGYHCPLCLSEYNHLILIEAEIKELNRVEIWPDNLSIKRIEEKCINY